MAKLNKLQNKLFLHLYRRGVAKTEQLARDGKNIELPNVDAQYAAIQLGFEPELFHATMNLLRDKGLITFNLGPGRNTKTGSEFNIGENSYWAKLTKIGNEYGQKLEEAETRDAKKIVVPVWQWILGILTVSLATVLADVAADKLSDTDEQEVRAIEHTAKAIEEVSKKLEILNKEMNRSPDTQPSKDNNGVGSNK
jgi:hypothetical protein